VSKFDLMVLSDDSLEALTHVGQVCDEDV